MNDIIQRAEEVARALKCYKAVNKAVVELNQIKDGRSSLTLQYLQVPERELDFAIDRADKDLDSEYTRLTSILGARK